MDNRSDLRKDLLEHYRIQQTLVSPYHPQTDYSNGGTIQLSTLSRSTARNLVTEWSSYLRYYGRIEFLWDVQLVILRSNWFTEGNFYERSSQQDMSR
jgi:hypothetical protein